MELFSVMVTGANRGIGLEFVRQLTQIKPPPKHIFASYRDKNSIQELKSIQNASGGTTQIHLIKMEVTNEEDINNAAKLVEDIVQEQGLTLFLNNAGVAKPLRFPGITAENLNFHFRTNTVAPLLLAQIFYPLLKKSAERKSKQKMGFSRAGILNISSMVGSIENLGVFVGDIVAPAYKMSKASLNMGMRVIAAEAKKDNIIIIMMCPGWVKAGTGTEYAPLEAKDSIAAMLDTISKLNETHTGTFIDRFGKPIPY